MAGRVFAVKPLRMTEGAGSGPVCVKFEYMGWELSMSFDDSCGTGAVCHRNSIAVFSGEEDWTEKVFGEKDMQGFDFIEFCDCLDTFKDFVEEGEY